MHFTYRPLDDTDYLGDISLDNQESSNNDDQNLFDNSGKLEIRKQRSKSAKSSKGKENKTVRETEDKSLNKTKSSSNKSKFSKRSCSERLTFQYHLLDTHN